MRIVYDTNVAATLLFRRGEILKLKHAIKNGLVVITSGFILDEIAEVLRLRLSMTKQQSKARARAYARLAKVVRPTNIEPVTRDPDDDYILATAVEGHAKYLVSLDQDLLVLKQYKGILIVTPSEFSEILSKQNV